MFKILRIISSVIAAILLAADIFIFIYCGLVWGFVCLGGVLLFYLFTIFFKNKQEAAEHKDDEKHDFIP